MKRLQFYGGGQPFRSTDFQMMQDEQITAILAVIKAFCPGACIISGVTLAGTVSGGYIYDGVEVCQVVESGVLHEGEFYVLRPITEQQVPRTFPNGQTHNMVSNRYYQVVSTATMASGDIRYDTMIRLTLFGPSSFQMLNNSTVAFGSTFSGRNSFTAIHVASNGAFGERMLTADF